MELFKQVKPIAFYPKERLNESGFLLEKSSSQLFKKYNSEIVAIPLLEYEMQRMLSTHINHTIADVFIPAGGRPGTLSRDVVHEYLDHQGIPTSRAIIEGANLYLSAHSRQFLEERGVLIIKDSSANKGGVICSSFEVLAGLTLTEEEFAKHKEEIVKEILEKIEKYSSNEVRYILTKHHDTRQFCSKISDELSDAINGRAMLFLQGLEEGEVVLSDEHLWSFFAYCLPLLRNQYVERLLHNIPPAHKRAIIATYLATEQTYALP
jgi:glutamate dehydrogenase